MVIWRPRGRIDWNSRPFVADTVKAGVQVWVTNEVVCRERYNSLSTSRAAPLSNLSEQFPTSPRGRGHFFGETVARLLGGVLAPFLLSPYSGSPVIFFGSVLVVVAIGVLPPLLYGRENIGQLEVVAHTGVPAAATSP